MSRTPEQRFEAGAIVVVVERPLRGRRGVTLPDRVRGYPTDGRREAVRPGERWEGAGVLVDLSPISLALRTEPLPDRAGVTASVEVELTLDPPSDATTAQLLADRRPERSDFLDRATLARQLSDGLTARVRRALTIADWSHEAGCSREAHRTSPTEGLSLQIETGTFVEESLRGALFERGLELTRLGPIRVRSDDLEARRHAAKRREESESEARRRREELERWRETEEARLRAKREVERARVETERDRLRLRVDRRRAERSAAIESQIEEARDRSRLRRELERQRWKLSTELEEERLQREIERAHAVEARLNEARISEPIAEALASRWLDGADPRAEKATPVRRLWLAAGVGLQRVSVGREGRLGSRAIPVLPTEDLGWLRSVSIDASAPSEILVGGQHGVGIFDQRRRQWECYRYPSEWVYPSTPVRGGANGVHRTDRFVIATHSELGLCAWPRNGGPIERWGPSGAPIAGCRALHRVGTHQFRFAAGRSVWQLSIVSGEPRFDRLGTLDTSVTALATHEGCTLAGTRDGRLFRFDGDRPVAFEFQSALPIYSIARDTAEEGGWIVGTREPEVRVIDDQGRLVRVHQSRYPIRWVASGGGELFGVDRMGLGLSQWRSVDPHGSVASLRLSDRIQSLAVECESVEGEAS